MPRRQSHSHLPRCLQPAAAALHRWWLACRQRHRVAIAVLLAEPVRRRQLERDVRWAVALLERTLDRPFPSQTTVIVQQAIGGERHLAGAYQVLRSDGEPDRVRIQLAAQVGRRRLTTEEVLATLAEVALRLGDERVDAMRSVRVPLTLPLDLPEQPAPRRPSTLPDDPLAPVTPIADHPQRLDAAFTRPAA